MLSPHRIDSPYATPGQSAAALALCLVLLNASAASAAGETNAASSPVSNPMDVLRAGQRGGGDENARCNVPTDGTPSPLTFDGQTAIPFTQSFLREEGFGTAHLVRDTEDCVLGAPCGTHAPYPAPRDVDGNWTPYSPQTSGDLDALIGYGSSLPGRAPSGFDGLRPFPTYMRNDTVRNPWQAAIEATHTGPLAPLSPDAPRDAFGAPMTSFADGRAPGMQYAHQRYDEFFPTRYMKTAVTGARENTGVRDANQMHLYASGEWRLGGLYHNTVHGLAASVCTQEPSLSTSRAACEAATLSDPASAYFGASICRWDEAEDRCSGTFDGTTEGLPVRFHPLMPVQDEQTIWTFDGTFPPKLLMARYGQPILFRNHNALPIKFEANRGFGNHFITTHEHNGHVGAESDGYAEAFFLPGQFYDYHWPLVLAGHDSNPEAKDPRASTPCKPGETLAMSRPSPTSSAGRTCSRAESLAENPTKTGDFAYGDPTACGWRTVALSCPSSGENAGRVNIAGDWRETMSTHWFHDHMLDYTAQNVYKGNAAMMNYYSSIDRGNECLDDGVNLRFPAGCAMGEYSWGNRDYDLNIMLSSKAWGQDTSRYVGTKVEDTRGQLWFNPFNTDGFVGDRMLVNMLWMPFLDVRQRSYRMRLLNADVSRFMALAFVVARDDDAGEFPGDVPGTSYDRVPIFMIANDGNIMEHAIPFDGSLDLDRDGDRADHDGILPTQSIAERYDIIIDFAAYAPGTKIYMLNLLEHENGKRPEQQLPLATVLSGGYSGCDSAVGKMMEMRVHPCTMDDGTTPAESCAPGGNAMVTQQDMSMDPSRYVPGNANGPGGAPLRMIPLPQMTPNELASAHHRTFSFGRGAASDGQPVTITPAEFTSAEPANAASSRLMPAPSTATEPGGGYGWSRNGRSVNTAEHEQIPEHPDIPWGIKTDGRGPMRAANMNEVTAAPQIGDLEIWHLENGGGGWSHNVHVHFEEGRILTRDGGPPPEWEKWARKDVYRVGRMDDSGSEVTFAIRFREFGGSYMEHCHNTQHEDHAMLMRWDIENPGQLKPFLLPEPQWNGCTYTESEWLPSASAQNASRPGDPDANADFWKDYRPQDVLCPDGVTQGCPGGETARAEATAPAPAVETAVIVEPTRAERRRDRAEAKAQKRAEKRARREAKRARRKNR